MTFYELFNGRVFKQSTVIFKNFIKAVEKFLAGICVSNMITYIDYFNLQRLEQASEVESSGLRQLRWTVELEAVKEVD